MCGRFYLDLLEKRFEEAFGVPPPEGYRPRHNIAPTQQILAMTMENESDCVSCAPMWWGISSRIRGSSKPHINAKGDAPSRVFSDEFQHRRCLVPACGYYEWQAQADSKTKRPHAIRLADEAPFYFAGIWCERGESGEREVAVVTTTPNVLMAPIHRRMPVMFSVEQSECWLGGGSLGMNRIQSLCKPFDAGAMTAFEVSTRVNRVQNDDPSLLAPCASGPMGLFDEKPEA